MTTISCLHIRRQHEIRVATRCISRVFDIFWTTLLKRLRTCGAIPQWSWLPDGRSFGTVVMRYTFLSPRSESCALNAGKKCGMYAAKAVQFRVSEKLRLHNATHGVERHLLLCIGGRMLLVLKNILRDPAGSKGPASPVARDRFACCVSRLDSLVFSLHTTLIT